MTEGDMIQLLAERYPAPEYAFLPGVRNGTGAQRTTREADAIAMSLWPSRGTELHGFEVKVSRGDWLRELKEPAKAEEIARRCDRWWVAVAERDMVKPGELPPTWGLLAPRGGKLVQVIEAPRLPERGPLDRAFLAALLRRVVEQWRPIELVQVEAKKLAHAYSPRELEIAKAEAAQEKHAKERAEKALEELRASMRAFEEKSGLQIDQWSGGWLGDRVRAFMAANDEKKGEQFAEWARRARGIAEVLEAGAKALVGA